VVNLGSLQKAIDDKKLDAGKPSMPPPCRQPACSRRVRWRAPPWQGRDQDQDRSEGRGASASAIAAVEKAGGKVELPPKPVAEAA
jgi:hypothetical protein